MQQSNNIIWGFHFDLATVQTKTKVPPKNRNTFKKKKKNSTVICIIFDHWNIYNLFCKYKCYHFYNTIFISINDFGGLSLLQNTPSSNHLFCYIYHNYKCRKRNLWKTSRYHTVTVSWSVHTEHLVFIETSFQVDISEVPKWSRSRKHKNRNNIRLDSQSI